MKKYIEVTMTIEVPSEATDKDIQDWVHVELERVNSMKQDNPCIDGADPIDSSWKHLS
ncbi:conserved hypothetical protein [Vibrio chagasii]|nr:conserved hypothetical protein [Vibrio chagasii]